jgi:hypothetical protein
MDHEDSESDWLAQSREMDKIYQASYLNISATAAVDSDQGLFFRRTPDDLWEDEISLNLTGLIIPEQATDETLKNHTDFGPIVISSGRPSSSGSKKRQLLSSNTNTPRKLRRMDSEYDPSRMNERIGADYLKRCTIIDVAFWDDLVDQAPVNQRGWVLQERIMAPRVLHFCANQIAWECSEFQDAEGHPEGLPTLRTRLGDIVDEGRLKSLRQMDGLRLREIRLKGFPDPDKNLKNLHVYELWKRLVEVYSQKTLTMSRDKLVALSGIAKQFGEQIKCDYVAGMWREHLESQLLWQVNEIFKDGGFHNSAKRDSSRAPSFSWASLDTPYGIIYGEATDYGENRADELLFEVKSHHLVPVDERNVFGLINAGGYIVVRPDHLRPIQLQKLQPPRRIPYCWRLIDNTSNKPAKDHFNMYLDAPEADLDIFRKEAKLFCMPAAFGERTTKKTSRYLICLLLKLEKTKENVMHFKRFGLTKLSNYADEEEQKVLRGKKFNKDIWIF